jgi:hypothetical protein
VPLIAAARGRRQSRHAMNAFVATSLKPAMASSRFTARSFDSGAGSRQFAGSPRRPLTSHGDSARPRAGQYRSRSHSFCDGSNSLRGHGIRRVVGAVRRRLATIRWRCERIRGDAEPIRRCATRNGAARRLYRRAESHGGAMSDTLGAPAAAFTRTSRWFGRARRSSRSRRKRSAPRPRRSACIRR